MDKVGQADGTADEGKIPEDVWHVRFSFIFARQPLYQKARGKNALADEKNYHPEWFTVERFYEILV